MKDIESFLNALHTRTELEELLNWDSELVDYLVGAWGNMALVIDQAEGVDAKIALMVAQLPPDRYEEHEEKLEQWVTTNYNLFVR